MLTVYGIKNCNTMKKCFDFLNEQGVAYQFFDYKKSVLEKAVFEQMVATFGLDKVINKQGTTYKKWSDEQKQTLADGDLSAIYALVADNQSVIKRPIILGNHQNQAVDLIGFDEQQFTQIFGS